MYTTIQQKKKRKKKRDDLSLPPSLSLSIFSNIFSRFSYFFFAFIFYNPKKKKGLKGKL